MMVTATERLPFVGIQYISIEEKQRPGVMTETGKKCYSQRLYEFENTARGVGR